MDVFDLKEGRWNGYLYNWYWKGSFWGGCCTTLPAAVAVHAAVPCAQPVTGRWPVEEPQSLCLNGAAHLPYRRCLGQAGQRDGREGGGWGWTAGGDVGAGRGRRGDGCVLGR